MHASAFEPSANGHLASGFHNARGGAQALGVELWVAHAVSVGLEIVKAATCFLRARDLAADGVEQRLKFSGVEFFLPTFCPLRCAWMSEAVESFSEITQVLFGMIAVNNLGGIGKLILGEIPNPKGPISELRHAARHSFLPSRSLSVVASRLERSGMFWTVRGANAILALRCCHLNGEFEDYWEARRAA